MNSPRRHGRRFAQWHRPRRTIVWNVEHSQAAWRRQHRYDALPRRRYAAVLDHRTRLNWVQWHLGRTYAELRDASPRKERDLSAVVSAASELEGQRLRLRLLRHLDRRDLSFLDGPFDHYGRSNEHGMRHYRGALPPGRKEAGLEPYRYSLALEAAGEPNYASEKFFDCILCECLPFYWGAPNLEEWFDPACFVRIDPADPEAAYETLRKTIQAGEWERRLPAIREAKRRILEEYNVFPVLERLVLRLEEGEGR